jgi:hypothetical protein
MLPDTSMAKTIAGLSPLTSLVSRNPLLLRSSKTAPWMVPKLPKTSTVKVWVSVPPRLSLTWTLKLTRSW